MKNKKMSHNKYISLIPVVFLFTHSVFSTLHSPSAGQFRQTSNQKPATKDSAPLTTRHHSLFSGQFRLRRTFSPYMYNAADTRDSTRRLMYRIIKEYRHAKEQLESTMTGHTDTTQKINVSLNNHMSSKLKPDLKLSASPSPFLNKTTALPSPSLSLLLPQSFTDTLLENFPLVHKNKSGTLHDLKSHKIKLLRSLNNIVNKGPNEPSLNLINHDRLFPQKSQVAVSSSVSAPSVTTDIPLPSLSVSNTTKLSNETTFRDFVVGSKNYTNVPYDLEKYITGLPPFNRLNEPGDKNLYKIYSGNKVYVPSGLFEHITLPQQLIKSSDTLKSYPHQQDVIDPSTSKLPVDNQLVTRITTNQPKNTRKINRTIPLVPLMPFKDKQQKHVVLNDFQTMQIVNMLLVSNNQTNVYPRSKINDLKADIITHRPTSHNRTTTTDSFHPNKHISPNKNEYLTHALNLNPELSIIRDILFRADNGNDLKPVPPNKSEVVLQTANKSEVIDAKDHSIQPISQTAPTTTNPRLINLILDHRTITNGTADIAPSTLSANDMAPALQHQIQDLPPSPSTTPDFYDPFASSINSMFGMEPINPMSGSLMAWYLQNPFDFPGVVNEMMGYGI